MTNEAWACMCLNVMCIVQQNITTHWHVFLPSVHWAGQTIMGRLVALAMWATSHIADGALLLFQETRASLDAVVPALLQETPDAKRSYIIGIVTLNL